MTYVRNFVGYTPAPRFDGNPFIEALIGEGSTKAGPFTVIQTIALSPVDANPAKPLTRNLTTTNAQIQYGAWYQVSFRDAGGHVEEAPAVEGPVEPLGEDLRRSWLSRMLQNAPHMERETLIGDGVTVSFTLRGTPLYSPAMMVQKGGQVIQQGQEYNIEPVAGNVIVFNEAPANGEAVLVTYFQSVWPERELAYYIQQAEKQYFDDLGVVYQSAIFAIDAVMLGLATALNFGSGEETYDMQSVYQRVMETRNEFDAWLVQRQDEGAPITLVDIFGDDIGAGDYIEAIQQLNPLNEYNP